MRKFFSNHGTAVMIAVDVAALVVFMYFIPSMRRPLEVMMACFAILFSCTAATAKSNWLRNFMMMAASLAAGLFCLEMADKFFDITRSATPVPGWETLGEGGPYPWTLKKGSYFAAKDRARRDGVDPASLEEHFPGDIFAGTDASKLMKSSKKIREIGKTRIGYKQLHRTGTELGYEPNPDNTVRAFSRDEETGRYYFDAVYTTDSHGFRTTRGQPDAEEAVLFLGDSFVFGELLNDDATAPYYYNQYQNFEKNVVNAGTLGWGPHQVLRDLELEHRRIGPALQGSARVSAVYYSLIDDHADRCSVKVPQPLTTPRYVLDGEGVLRFRPFLEQGGGIRKALETLMERSRVYPVLRDRLANKYGINDERKWRLTVAILSEIDRLCQERYGVPLTIVYWDGAPMVMEMIVNAGLRLVPIEDAFAEGKDWEKLAIKYRMFDGHPSAYAQEKLARHLLTLQQLMTGN